MHNESLKKKEAELVTAKNQLELKDAEIKDENYKIKNNNIINTINGNHNQKTINPIKYDKIINNLNIEKFKKNMLDIEIKFEDIKPHQFK